MSDTNLNSDYYLQRLEQLKEDIEIELVYKSTLERQARQAVLDALYKAAISLEQILDFLDEQDEDVL